MGRPSLPESYVLTGPIPPENFFREIRIFPNRQVLDHGDRMVFERSSTEAYKWQAVARVSAVRACSSLWTQDLTVLPERCGSSDTEWAAAAKSCTGGR